MGTDEVVIAIERMRGVLGDDGTEWLKPSNMGEGRPEGLQAL